MIVTPMIRKNGGGSFRIEKAATNSSIERVNMAKASVTHRYRVSLPRCILYLGIFFAGAHDDPCESRIAGMKWIVSRASNSR